MAGAGGARLHAVVLADEARAAIGGAAAGLRVIACGSVAGIAGSPRDETTLRAALRHDRIVGRAVAACSSVVPFRLGTDARSSAALCAVLAVNEAALARQLVRLAGRAEMGLKVKLGSPAAIEVLHAGLASIRALAPRPEDRRERLIAPTVASPRRAGSAVGGATPSDCASPIPGADGPVFEGCYLVSRDAIAAYWGGVGELRAALRGAPMLGSGPWAAYSFCDLVLRPGSGRWAPVARQRCSRGDDVHPIPARSARPKGR